MNEKNLRPIKLSHEEATSNGRKGGIASGKARAKKRTQREILITLLTMSTGAGEPCDIAEIENIDALDEANISVNERIVLKLVQKALDGDANAYKTIVNMLENDLLTSEPAL